MPIASGPMSALLVACALTLAAVGDAQETTTRADVEFRYETLKARYENLRARGVDLSGIQPLVTDIEHAVDRAHWGRLSSLLERMERRLDALAQVDDPRTQPAEAPAPLTSSAETRRPCEARFLPQLYTIPAFRHLLAFRAHAGLISSHGAAGRNHSGFQDVAAQREATWLLLRGLASGEAAWIERSVRALEYGYRFQTEAGYFENRHGVVPVRAAEAAAFFLQSYGHVYLALGCSDLADEPRARLGRYREEAKHAMAWLHAHTDALRALADGATNRLVFDALAFVLNGKVLGDPRYVATGHAFLNEALEAQRPAGWFVEHGGHDTSYQAVSILTLSIAWLHLDDGSLREKVYAALERAVAWQKQQIEPTGRVRVAGNTRTGRGQERFLGKTKEVNYPEVALALFLWSQIGDDPQSRKIAARVVEYMLQRRGR